jgi:hypothetical protein
MLTEQTLVLSGPNGRRSGTAYAIGVIAILLVYVGALIFFGRSISLPSEPHLDAQLDILIGSILLLLAFTIHWRRPRKRAEKPPRAEMDAPAALAFGLVSMLTNFTTLALIVPASKEIAASDLEFFERAIVALLLVALAAIPAWVPLALTMVAPGRASKALQSIGGFISRSGRLASVLLLALFGLILVGRGILRLVG